MKYIRIRDAKEVIPNVVYKADFFNSWTKENSGIMLSKGRDGYKTLYLLSNRHIVAGQRKGEVFGYENMYPYGNLETLKLHMKGNRLIIYKENTGINKIEII